MNTSSVLLLGSTGSVGHYTLEKIESLGLKLHGITFNLNTSRALEIINKHQPKYVFATNQERKEIVESKFPHIKVYGSLEDMIEFIKNDTEEFAVVNALGGLYGLLPSIATLNSGRKLIIANKESVVVGGSHFLDLAQYEDQIIPIDSEHYSLFTLLKGVRRSSISKILMSASGGPFFFKNKEDFKHITKEEALNHPVWNMGKVITVASSTMANKGMEVLEAKELFKFPVDQISIIVQPQSFSHAGVLLKNQTMVMHQYNAQMGIPIASALCYPEYYPNDEPIIMPPKTDFYHVDMERFPLLKIAYEVGEKDHQYQIAYSLANELAINLFLQDKISYLDMAHCVSFILDSLPDIKIHSLEDVINSIEVILSYIQTKSQSFKPLL